MTDSSQALRANQPRLRGLHRFEVAPCAVFQSQSAACWTRVSYPCGGSPQLCKRMQALKAGSSGSSVPVGAYANGVMRMMPSPGCRPLECGCVVCNALRLHPIRCCHASLHLDVFGRLQLRFAVWLPPNRAPLGERQCIAEGP